MKIIKKFIFKVRSNKLINFYHNELDKAHSTDNDKKYQENLDKLIELCRIVTNVKYESISLDEGLKRLKEFSN